MNKLVTMTLLCTVAFTSPVFAQTANDQDIKSDVGAINKDNTALSKDNADIATDRAKKAADKANGNYGKQAVDSMAIGADKTVKQEKVTEKDADQKILQHHKKKVATDTDASQTTTDTTK